MNSITWNFIEINLLIVILFATYGLLRNQLSIGSRRMFLNAIPFFALILIILKAIFDLSEIGYHLQVIELNPVVIDADGVKSINHSMAFGLITIYQIGLLLITPVFIYRLLRVIRFFISNQAIKEGRYRIYRVKGKDSFSFFNRIQIAPELSEDDQRIVIEHEKLHANKLHSLDVLIVELLHVIFWVNPVFFWMKRELINLHEFQVDELMYRKHKVSYLKFLINYALGLNGPHYLLTSQFYNQLSLKKRIQNMKTRTKKRAWMMVVIPIIGLASLMVQCTKEVVYDQVEVEPVYKGEEGAMVNYLIENINYPKAAKDAGIEGTVYVGFVVRSDGSIDDVAVRKEVNEFLDAEAVRVISEMPDWVPGEQDGKKVSVSYTIPIRFAL